MGRHYLGDVIAGLLVGVATTAIVTKVSQGAVNRVQVSNIKLQ